MCLFHVIFFLKSNFHSTMEYWRFIQLMKIKWYAGLQHTCICPVLPHVSPEIANFSLNSTNGKTTVWFVLRTHNDIIMISKLYVYLCKGPSYVEPFVNICAYIKKNIIKDKNQHSICTLIYCSKMPFPLFFEHINPFIKFNVIPLLNRLHISWQQEALQEIWVL